MTRLVAALLGVGVFSAAAPAGPPEWPQFRGPGGAGVAEGPKPPTKLGPDTNVKWKVAVPPGFSSPVVAGDRLFLTAFENGKLYTVAYTRADGKELWRKEAPAKAIEAYHKTEGSPAASTPATDGERVVSYFGSCGLFCYDLAGNELWRHELPVAQTNNDFGTGSSPVIADGKVVLLRDQRTDARLLALDLKDGSQAWEVKREGVQTSWGSACVWDTPRGKQVVVAGSLRVNGYDLATGKEAWVVTGTPAIPCTTPVVAGGKLVFAGWSPGGGADFKMPAFDDVLKEAGELEQGYLTKAGSEKSFLKGFFDNNDTNKDGKITRDEWEGQLRFMAKGKNVAFALPPGGTGDVTKSLLWTATKGLPYVPSPLVYDGLVYTLDMRARLSAVDAKTGKPVFEDEAVGLGSVYASPVAAAGHLYLCGLDKKVVVVKAGESPDKVSTATLDDRIAATPAVVDGVIYIRTGKSLYAFAEKK